MIKYYYDNVRNVLIKHDLSTGRKWETVGVYRLESITDPDMPALSYGRFEIDEAEYNRLKGISDE